MENVLRMEREGGEIRGRDEESEDEFEEDQMKEEARRKPVWKRVLSLLKYDRQSSWGGFGRDGSAAVGRGAAASSSPSFIIRPDDW
ncbi:hypothetical protein COLO4_20601 [Corchorus olitorius]|uniref:Uncharacterized protein n=1 Tax=Corchorus olitorius TaxID=93759 RepID=A0A1R3IYU6_9ROSI|nr:hypothetical protein COLO4_20601 [Corchorus olitorius]